MNTFVTVYHPYFMYSSIIRQSGVCMYANIDIKLILQTKVYPIQIVIAS